LRDSRLILLKRLGKSFRREAFQNERGNYFPIPPAWGRMPSKKGEGKTFSKLWRGGQKLKRINEEISKIEKSEELSILFKGATCKEKERNTRRRGEGKSRNHKKLEEAGYQATAWETKEERKRGKGFRSSGRRRSKKTPTLH